MKVRKRMPLAQTKTEKVWWEKCAGCFSGYRIRWWQSRQSWKQLWDILGAVVLLVGVTSGCELSGNRDRVCVKVCGRLQVRDDGLNEVLLIMLTSERASVVCVCSIQLLPSNMTYRRASRPLPESPLRRLNRTREITSVLRCRLSAGVFSNCYLAGVNVHNVLTRTVIWTLW